jgi:hypothetical protein
VKLSSPDECYADRDVPHTAQGDIHAGVPFVHATLLASDFEAAGARKRPDALEPNLGFMTSHEGFGVVLHYTCGITAQPEGTEGYSHEFRLVAPIVSLRALKRWGLGNNEPRKIRDGVTIQGFMYLPQVEPILIDDPEEPEDEWTGHAAALIYRPATVSQALLDQQPRIARLTADATRILNAAMIQNVHSQQLRLVKPRPAGHEQRLGAELATSGRARPPA